VYCVQQTRYDSAVTSPRIEDLRRRVREDPASIAFAQLAEEHRRAGQYDEAIAVCRAGLERHPTHASARVTLGRSLMELGALDDALIEVTRVLTDVPDHVTALRVAGLVHRRQNRHSEASALFRRALALAPNDPDLMQAVHELSGMGARSRFVDRSHAERVIDRLERWLQAVHGARTQRHA
jgi:Flp pilus assembly protein TadD